VKLYLNKKQNQINVYVFYEYLWLESNNVIACVSMDNNVSVRKYLLCYEERNGRLIRQFPEFLYPGKNIGSTIGDYFRYGQN
jgi:hypothetical protein